uniref:Uncharacterized protein n=1 Tax=Populus davidiana TaxID=266767 RepID=A0A6M2EE54_9ROSI
MTACSLITKQAYNGQEQRKESSAESGAELPPLWEISFLFPLNGCVDGSDLLGILEILPLLFLAFGPNTSIMYFQPSIGLLLNMRSLIKLAEICCMLFDDQILGREYLPPSVTFPIYLHLVPSLLFPNHQACF